MKGKKYCVFVTFETSIDHVITAKNKEDAIKKTKEFYQGICKPINSKTDVWEVW